MQSLKYHFQPIAFSIHAILTKFCVPPFIYLFIFFTYKENYSHIDKKSKKMKKKNVIIR